MKVCLVSPELLPVPPIRGGAIETWIDSVAKELAQLGIDTHVISISVEIELQPQAKDNGITYHYVKIPRILERYPLNVTARGFTYFRRVGNIINKLRPDIVHHHNRPLGLLLAKSRYKFPCRHVMSLHNTDIRPDFGWFLLAKRADRIAFRRSFSYCDRMLGVSDFIRSYARERLSNYDPKRVHTLRNGVDSAVFMPNGHIDCRSQFGFSRDPLLLFAGRILPRKGVHVLLDVFQRVKREIPTAQLAIVGPMGSFWDKKATAYALDIQNEVDGIPGARLLEPIYDRTHLARLYGAADVACLPFLSNEPFGLTVIEMQACGVPVVTTRMGGVSEAVKDGMTGFLVSPNDVEMMSKKVVLLLRDAQLRKRMSWAARDLIEQEFSWKVVAERLLRHYEEVMDESL